MIFKYEIASEERNLRRSLEMIIDEKMFYWLSDKLNSLTNEIKERQCFVKVCDIQNNFVDVSPEFQETFQKHFKDILA